MTKKTILTEEEALVLAKIRLWSKVECPGEEACWTWQGALSQGYGHLTILGKHRLAHRVVYEWLVGPIPPRLVLDHLCDNPPCVNPAHLNAVTQRENLLRSSTTTRFNAEKTHCVRGHGFTEENTYYTPEGWRHCRACARRHQAILRHRRRSA